MMLQRWFFTVLLLVTLPASLAAQERYLVAYAGFAGFQAPVWAPKDLGLMAKYGFNGDVVLVPGSVRQIQALQGGSIHFAQADAATAINEALRVGMHALADMSEMKEASCPMNVMVARRSFVEKNREAVKRFQQAYAEGTHQFINDKEKGLAVLTKRLRQKNSKAIEETYQYFASKFSFPTRISPVGLRNTLELLSQRP